ncbi:MAG: hypothetical protein P4L50_21480 [Anaerolineaceae bacterium]|nr:hypothetical protein [Anaerolineaceae bacterium]
MSYKKFLFVLLGTLLVCLVGCGPAPLPVPPESTTPLPFAKLYQVKDLNKSLSLGLNQAVKSDLKSGSNIFLEVQNQSDQQIWFNADWQLRVYQSYSPNVDLWKLLENDVQYAGDGVVLYPKSGGGATTYSIVCIPVLSSPQSATVRVVVTGQFYKNGLKTGVPVSAYTDMTINP